MRSRHLSTVIRRPTSEVYVFAADPANLPRWAAGLAEGDVHVHGETVHVDSPLGRISVRFVPTNAYGVLDHDVTLPSGDVITNPLRVLAHPEGSEVVFTLRQLSMTDEEFDRDTAAVEADLDALRVLLEEPLAVRGLA